MPAKDVLSEGELDALMESVSDTGVPVDDASTGSDCQSFDFSTREQTLLAQMPALKTIIEKQSLAMVDHVHAYFKLAIEIETTEIRLIKLDEAIGNINSRAGINLVKVAPLNGITFVVLSGELLSFFVDQYFGGAHMGAETKTSRADLTPTEIRINDVLTEKFLLSMTEAWKEKIVLTPQLDSRETNTDFLRADSPDELAMFFSFVIKLDDWQSSIDWIVPYAALEPLRSELGSLSSGLNVQASADWEEYFRRELLSVDLEVSGLFTSRSVSIGEVLNLKVGSIVPLKTPTDVIVCIEGQPFSSGEHGTLNRCKSIKIKEIFQSEAT